MSGEFKENVRKQVGGSLGRVPIMKRIAMLQVNASVLRRQTQWKPPADDGTFVRKTVGSAGLDSDEPLRPGLMNH
jgi:hypothetical protein